MCQSHLVKDTHTHTHLNSLSELKDKHISWHNPNVTERCPTAAGVSVHLRVKVHLVQSLLIHNISTVFWHYSYSPQICRSLTHTKLPKTKGNNFTNIAKVIEDMYHG